MKNIGAVLGLALVIGTLYSFFSSSNDPVSLQPNGTGQLVGYYLSKIIMLVGGGLLVYRGLKK